jgi:deoxyribodipyrimidine photo-lyase
MFKKSLFVFRRDLRLEDNTGLIQALEKSESVIPCFVYDDKIKKSNVSEFRWNFLNESLLELNAELKKKKSLLQIFQGNPPDVIGKIILENNLDAVFLNADFSKYSQQRDAEIQRVCHMNNAAFNNIIDLLLHNSHIIKTSEEKPYTIYSYFYKRAKYFPVRQVLKNSKKNYYKEKLSDLEIILPTIKDPFVSGGRTKGLDILGNLVKFKNYKNFRDYPELDHTTKLSAHNKFGTVSIREVFHAIKNKLGLEHVLMEEVYWREFFNYVLFHFPQSQKKSFNKRFRKIQWSKSTQKFQSWCNGKTGFPIVDAGMNELNSTGFMHNRVRMIVASFLTKDLHLDWKWGERYFASKLVDYDPAVNVGNWQWVASTGCDSVPYFRIFNPWRQQEKFDSRCVYIKRWIPELKGIPSKTIHNLWNVFPRGLQYPKPIVDHRTESEITKQIFKSQF